MIKAELTPYGLHDALKYARDVLEDASGSKCNKHRKHEAIVQALGALDALWYMVTFYEDDDNCENNAKE